MTVLILLFVSAIATKPLLGQARARSDTCILGGQSYNVGETWHPQLLAVGEKSCVNCTCLEGGEVKCVGVTCPKPDCDEPKIVDGECCPSCEVRTEDDGNDVIELPGCEFHGEEYENGDVFPSNKTAYKPKNENQCVLCMCYRGEVICHLKTCIPNPRCRKVVKVEDDCCPQCEEEDTLEDEYLNSMFTNTGNQTLEEGDCMSNSVRQKNGSTWKPVVVAYGEMECIVCTCLNGQVNCRRLHCPEESSLKCKNPEHKQGGCCKECPSEEGKDKKKKKKKRKGKTKGRRKRCRKSSGDSEDIKKRCRRRRKSRNKRTKSKKGHKSDGKEIFRHDRSLNDVIHILCMPRKGERFVYHSKGDNFETISFDSPAENTIEHIRWTIKKGRILGTDRKVILEPEELRKNVTVGDLLGAVRKKDIQRFLKRVDRKLQRCKRKNKKCRRKLLERSMKRMGLKNVDLTKSCEV